MRIAPLFCALIAAFACGLPMRASAAAATKPPPPVPLMWKVSDADNAIYLLGSFHMLRQDDYPLSQDVDIAFDDAEALVFELSPEEVASPRLGMDMAQAALRTDGTTLDSELPRPVAARLHAWLDANSDALAAKGIPPSMMQAFEPWYVGLLVSLIEADKQGLDPKLGLDEHFMRLAAKAGKPATGLELGSEQIALFDGMRRDVQIGFLDDALTDVDKGADETGKVHAAWRRGDDAALLDDMAGEMRGKFPAVYNAINVARNDRWVPKLQALLDDAHDRDTLVVVGALHLLGSDGVVEKLRAKGYRVERICGECTAEPRPLRPRRVRRHR